MDLKSTINDLKLSYSLIKTIDMCLTIIWEVVMKILGKRLVVATYTQPKQELS